ncbi:MAG TPA: hypothetical protein VIE43_16335 [Thermoanaerobaculia bacterium]|jgi:hypothetical protein|nr:hypothetical protein [Thermoanaerobaculia bacterium]
MRKHPLVEGHSHTYVENFSTSSLEFYRLVREGISNRKIPDLNFSTVEWKEGGIGSANRTYLRVSREGLNFDICAAPFGKGYFFSSWVARIPKVLLDLLFIFLTGVLGIVFFKAIAFQAAAGEPEGGWAAVYGVFLAPLAIVVVLFLVGFFVRYANVGLEPTVLSMPIMGFCYGLFFRPLTYFNEDTAIMFREAVQRAVQEAIEEVTAPKDVQGLRELAPKDVTDRVGAPTH